MDWAKATLPAESASAVPSSSAEILFFMFVSSFSFSFFSLCSDAEIGVKLVHVGLQFRVRKTVDDLAVLDDVETVGDGGGKAEVLLDQQDRKSFGLQPRDGVADLLDDDGRKALG